MQGRAELTAKLSYILESRFPITNYSLSNSGERIWHPPFNVYCAN